MDDFSVIYWQFHCRNSHHTLIVTILPAPRCLTVFISFLNDCWIHPEKDIASWKSVYKREIYKCSSSLRSSTWLLKTLELLTSSLTYFRRNVRLFSITGLSIQYHNIKNITTCFHIYLVTMTASSSKYLFKLSNCNLEAPMERVRELPVGSRQSSP